MGIPYGQARRSIHGGDDWVNVLTGQVVALLDSGELLVGWAPQTALQRFAERTGAYIVPDLMDEVIVTRWAVTPADVAALASDAASMVALEPGWARGSDRAKAAIRGLRTAMDPTGRSMRVETPAGTFGAEVCDDDPSKPIDLYVYLEREGCEPVRVAAVEVGRDGAIGGYFLEDTLERVPASRAPSARRRHREWRLGGLPGRGARSRRAHPGRRDRDGRLLRDNVRRAPGRRGQALGPLERVPLPRPRPRRPHHPRRDHRPVVPAPPAGRADPLRKGHAMDLDWQVQELLAAALTGAGAAKALGAVVASLPAATAVRALVAACEDLGVDWESWLAHDPAAVRELLSEPESARVATPYGDLVARTYDDSGTYMGIIVDLEKPDGTSGQVSITEAVADAARDVYPTPIHTFAYDGVHEDCVASTDLHPDGPEMGYPCRSQDISDLEGRQP